MSKQIEAMKQEAVALPCCGFADASALKWNPYNQVVQCHNCGQVYTALTPAPYPPPPLPHPPPQQDLPDLIAGALGVSRGTAYDMMREALAEASPPDPCCWPGTSCEAQREWVNATTWRGLTPEQRASIAEANNMLVDDDLFDAIEAKLKEKNT